MYLGQASSSSYTIDNLAAILTGRTLTAQEYSTARAIFGGDTAKRASDILTFHSMIVQQDPMTNTPEAEALANALATELRNAAILAAEREQRLAAEAVAIWEAENPELAAQQAAAIEANKARGRELLAQLELTASEINAQLAAASGELEGALRAQATALGVVGGIYYAMANQGLSPDEVANDLNRALSDYSAATQRVQAITNRVQTQAINTATVVENFNTLESFESAPVAQIVEELKKIEEVAQAETAAATAQVIADTAAQTTQTNGATPSIMDFTFSNIPVTFSQVYIATFGRLPDVEGFNYWKGIVGGDLSLKEYDDFVYAGRMNGENVNEENVQIIRQRLAETPTETAITTGGNTGLLIAAALAALTLLG